MGPKTACSMIEGGESCKLRVVKLVGLCKHCAKEFCNKHRLQETHNCEKLETIKIDQRNNLEVRLNKEKIIAQKIQKF